MERLRRRRRPGARASNVHYFGVVRADRPDGEPAWAGSVRLQAAQGDSVHWERCELRLGALATFRDERGGDKLAGRVDLRGQSVSAVSALAEERFTLFAGQQRLCVWPDSADDRRGLFLALSQLASVADGPWTPDAAASGCACCERRFSVTRRRHHCRLCGRVVCDKCSPFEAALGEADARARMCVDCHDRLDSAAAHSGEADIVRVEQPALPLYVYAFFPFLKPELQRGVRVGRLHVRVLEARGLPVMDLVSSDPYVVLTLTGLTSYGQEWTEERRATRRTAVKHNTLRPTFNESFEFSVPRAGAVLRVEAFDHDVASADELMGAAELPLARLSDGATVQEWLLLRRRDGKPAGHVHVATQFSFSLPGLLCSQTLWPEQPYQVDWPRFKVDRLYNNFWRVLDDMWPYLEGVWAVLAVLDWARPAASAAWLAAALLACHFLEWVPFALHVAVIGATLWRRVGASVRVPVAAAAGGAPALALDGDLDGDGDVDAADAAAKAEMEESLGRVANFIGKRMANQKLADVQNNVAWWSGVFASVRCMFDWSCPGYTPRVLAALGVSAALHAALPFRRLLMALVVFLFVVRTPLWTALLRLVFGVPEAVALLRQRRAARRERSRSSAARMRGVGKRVLSTMRLRRSSVADLVGS